MDNTDTLNEIRKELRVFAGEMESQRYFYLVWLMVAVGFVSFFMTFLLLYINPQGIDLRYTVTFGALVPSAIVYLLLSRSYLEKNKRKLINSLCRASGFRECENGCFSIGAAMKHKILPAHNKSTMETGIQGQFNNTPMAVQEIILTALKQDPKHRRRKKEYLRFWGLVVRFGLKRPMAGHTVVVPGPVMQTFFRNDFSGYEKVALNDGKFSRFYDVKTTDKIDAKFILNSSFRENFSACTKDLKAYWAVASFKDNEVLLAFQRFRPLISPTPLWKPVTEDGLLNIVKELESLARIINVLKSNPQVAI